MGSFTVVLCPGLVRHSAWLTRGLRCCIYTSDLDQTWIGSLTSSLFQMCQLSAIWCWQTLCLQSFKLLVQHQKTSNGMRVMRSPTPEQSWPELAHLFCISVCISPVNTVLYGGQINQAFKPSPKHEDWLQQNQGSGFKGTCKTPSGICQYCLGHHTLNYHYSPPPFFFVW